MSQQKSGKLRRLKGPLLRMPASNTFDCFREFIGQKVLGVFQNPKSGEKTLVFEDGRGLTFSGQSTYWVTSAGDITLAVFHMRKDLEKLSKDLKDVIKLAGDKKSSRSSDG